MSNRARHTLSRTLVALTLTLAAPLAAPSRGQAQDDAAGASVDGLRMTEITLARAVEGGRAVDPTSTFSARDGRVFVVIRLENSTGAETELRVSFEPADREVAAGPGAGAGVTLQVPASRRYRTIARTGTRAPGRYRVVVRTAAGNVLGTAEYEVTG